ncbi:MAG: trehalose-6-phosphate synthase [Comamonas sp.]|nr:trehalose-6-phosphate synthase [Comamonas sp.]
MKLIIVSNRVSYDEKPQSGGLAAAIQDTFKSINGMWIGWSGEISEEVQRKNGKYENIEYKVFSLNEKEYQDYYLNFSNEVLWPVCHLRPSYLRLIENSYATYQKVNQQFAQEVAANAKDQDLVWVHDYHLLLTGYFLRQTGHGGALAYFHHIPIPPLDLIRTIPHHCEIFSGLTSYDLVGVQTKNDLKNLFEYFNHYKQPGVVIQTQGEDAFYVEQDGQSTHFSYYPISIDTKKIEEMSKISIEEKEIHHLKESLGHRQLLIGVDRLDYSKGLENKFHAFDTFLKNYAAQHQPVLLQIANKSRSDLNSYQDLCSGLEALASSINGDHGNPSYTPIRYVNTVYDHASLTGLYRAARVGLVTPTKDGMNLVAKEFVASQNPEDPGVLILSEFAGAASELNEALLINPFHTQSVAQSIAQALEMPQWERVQRHRSMLKKLRAHTIQTWHERFIADLMEHCHPRRWRRTGS